MVFKRQNLGKVKRIKKSWRKPKGLHSNQREKKKSHAKMPNVGYRTPKKIRGFHPNGEQVITINCLKNLEGLSKGVVVKLSRMGAKKKIEAIKICDNKGIKIINFKDTKKKVKSLIESLENKRKAKIERKELRVKMREEERKKREAAKKKKEEEKKVKIKKKEAAEETKKTVKIKKSSQKTKKGADK